MVKVSYIVKYDIYKAKLLLLCLIAETSSHVTTLFIRVSSAFLSPKLIGSCKLDVYTTKRNKNYYTFLCIIYNYVINVLIIF